MATAKKATKKTATKKVAEQPPAPQAPPQQHNGTPSDQLVGITFEEFYNVMSQMYPDQSARVVAELKSAKLEQMVRELRGEV